MGRWPVEEPSFGRRSASTRSVVQLSQAVTYHNVHESGTLRAPLWLMPWLFLCSGCHYNERSVKSEEGLPFLTECLSYVLDGVAEKDIALNGDGEYDKQPAYHPGPGNPQSHGP